MDRRQFLRAAPALGIAVATPAVATPSVTPLERLDAALSELKEAAKAFDPSIIDWHIRYAVDRDLDCRLVIAAFRKKLGD